MPRPIGPRTGAPSRVASGPRAFGAPPSDRSRFAPSWRTTLDRSARRSATPTWRRAWPTLLSKPGPTRSPARAAGDAATRRMQAVDTAAPDPTPSTIRRVHDKAFAIETAERNLGLLVPRTLAPAASTLLEPKPTASTQIDRSLATSRRRLDAMAEPGRPSVSRSSHASGPAGADDSTAGRATSTSREDATGRSRGTRGARRARSSSLGSTARPTSPSTFFDPACRRNRDRSADPTRLARRCGRRAGRTLCAGTSARSTRGDASSRRSRGRDDARRRRPARRESPRGRLGFFGPCGVDASFDTEEPEGPRNRRRFALRTGRRVQRAGDDGARHDRAG